MASKSPATSPRNKPCWRRQRHSRKLDGSKLHIGIVQARFNEGITNALAKACRAELQALGVPDDHIQHVLVPGALEVPVALQAMAESDNSTR
jgi:6,7-dimethyl-8-ribityllumazine synthase